MQFVCTCAWLGFSIVTQACVFTEVFTEQMGPRWLPMWYTLGGKRYSLKQSDRVQMWQLYPVSGLALWTPFRYRMRTPSRQAHRSSWLIIQTIVQAIKTTKRLLCTNVDHAHFLHMVISGSVFVRFWGFGYVFVHVWCCVGEGRHWKQVEVIVSIWPQLSWFGGPLSPMVDLGLV